MPQAETVASILPWDSDFFGLRVGRSTRSDVDGNVLKSWSRKHDVQLLYHLVELDVGRLTSLIADGFTMVAVQVVLNQDLPTAAGPPAGAAPDVIVRPATQDDIEALLPLARQAHVGSRFFSDEKIDDERCEDLYAAWLQNSLHGFADAVLVAEDGMRRPCGYITVSAEGSQSSIGLVAVAPEHRGRGVAKQLIHGVQTWCFNAGMDSLDVVTQGNNVGAQRLYQSVGLRTSAVRIWFHLWS